MGAGGRGGQEEGRTGGKGEGEEMRYAQTRKGGGGVGGVVGVLGRGGVLESLLTPRAVKAIQSVRDRLCRSCPRGGAEAGAGAGIAPPPTPAEVYSEGQGDRGQIDPRTSGEVVGGRVRLRGPVGADNTQENIKKQTGGARFISKTLSVLDRDSDDETGYLGSGDIDPTGFRTPAGKRESVSWGTVTGWV